MKESESVTEAARDFDGEHIRMLSSIAWSATEAMENAWLSVKARPAHSPFVPLDKLEAITKLAVEVAHELSEFLTPIMSRCDALLVGLLSSDSTYADLKEIDKAVHLAFALTRQLLVINRERVEAPCAQLARTKELAAIERASERVTHDLNTLLTLIVDYSEFLLDDPSTNDTVRTDLGKIEQYASRALLLTRLLLAISQRIKHQRKVIGLNATVTDMEKAEAACRGEKR